MRFVGNPPMDRKDMLGTVYITCHWRGDVLRKPSVVKDAFPPNLDFVHVEQTTRSLDKAGVETAPLEQVPQWLHDELGLRLLSATVP